MLEIDLLRKEQNEKDWLDRHVPEVTQEPREALGSIESPTNIKMEQNIEAQKAAERAARDKVRDFCFRLLVVVTFFTVFQHHMVDLLEQTRMFAAFESQMEQRMNQETSLHTVINPL